MNLNKSRLKAILESFLLFLKRKSTYKFIKTTAIVFAVLAGLFLISWFACRNWLLEKAVSKTTAKLQEKGYTFSYSKKGFEGIFGVYFNGLYLNPSKMDSSNLFSTPLLKADKIGVSISLWRSIWYGPSIGNLSAVNLSAYLVDSASSNNFKKLLKSDSLKEKKESNKDNLAQKLFKKIKKAIGQSPARIELSKINVHYQDSNRHLLMEIPSMNYLHSDINGEILLGNKSSMKGFSFSGELDRDDLSGDLTVKASANKQFAEIPFISGGLGFKSAHFKLNSLDQTSRGIEFDAQGEIEQLKAEDRRISDTLVTINRCAGRFLAYFGKSSMELDSQSQVELNGLKTQIYARYDMGENPIYALKFNIPEINAQQFFSSLPAGLFRNMAGIRATGKLAYRFNFELEHKHPQDCIFESDMSTSKDFKIIKWGMADPNKLNSSFIHQFYDKGKMVAEFAVGVSNPYFTPYNEISHFVPQAVMKSEDPSFFHHHGFYTQAFRSSIAHNYRLKRFARGGSTISMQLVKNVFLGRKKTMARKIEEILLVWLMEDQHIVSKTRMLEVYLNIIEWGPGIFGIGQASDFYFEKHPSELNLGEATFLASIIPSPKNAGWAIDSSGGVKDRFGHFRLLKNRLLAMQDSSSTIDTSVFNIHFSQRAMQRLKGRKKKTEISPVEELISPEEMQDENME